MRTASDSAAACPAVVLGHQLFADTGVRHFFVFVCSSGRILTKSRRILYQLAFSLPGRYGTD